MKAFFESLITFSGRVGRLRYFLGTLLVPLATVIIFLLMCGGVNVFIEHFSSKTLTAAIGLLIIPITLALLFLYVVSPLSFVVRRFHDLNFSGWWLLAVWAWMGAIIVTVGVLFDDNHTAWVLPFYFLAMVPGLILLFKRGTKGDNKYGQDPLSE